MIQEINNSVINKIDNKRKSMHQLSTKSIIEQLLIIKRIDKMMIQKVDNLIINKSDKSAINKIYESTINEIDKS